MAARSFEECVMRLPGPFKHYLSFSHLQLVKAQYPQSFLGMVGISAGSGQIVSYLGHAGADSVVDAAAALCPSYTLQSAFEMLDSNSPKMSSVLAKNCQDLFILRNEEVICERGKGVGVGGRGAVFACLHGCLLACHIACLLRLPFC